MTAPPQPLTLATLADPGVACRLCEAAGALAHANPFRPTELREPRILLIGQAPGPVTDRKGYHFAGPAGRVLEQWFDRAGFPPGYFREHVFLSSLTRCFPGKATSGSGDRPPSRQEIALCRPYLDVELRELGMPLVILVGKMAIEAFLGKQPLTALVGKVYEIEGQRYLPLPHASGVSRWLNAPENRALVDTAIQQLARLRQELGL